MCPSDIAPRRTVLLVQEDVVTRDTEAELLATAGYEVHEAVSLEAAWDCLRQLPRPAVLLLELRMPTWDGEALLRRLHTSGAGGGLGVIAACALDIPWPEGVAAMLLKPFTRGALLQAVAACFDQAGRVPG